MPYTSPEKYDSDTSNDRVKNRVFAQMATNMILKFIEENENLLEHREIIAQGDFVSERRDSRLTGAVQASYRTRFAACDILNLFEIPKSATQISFLTSCRSAGIRTRSHLFPKQGC